MNFKSLIRTIPDYPKPGILFRDITTLIANPVGLRAAVDGLVLPFLTAGIQHVAGIEARGFIFGAALAYQLSAGFVPVRKPGKLPHKTIAHDYELEYGTNRVEAHVDGLAKGERVVIVDDLLATGGTALAAASLVEQMKAEVVEAAFLIELTDLPGRARLEKHGVRVHALTGFREDEG